MKKKILVVEDSPTQAQRATLILESQGYDVSWAADGALGLVEALTYSPDLVVTDLMMPNMDGYQMTSRLKSDPVTSEVPVVMLTTKGEVGDIIKGLAAGADNFITKPYESNYLVSRIENIFKNLEGREQDERGDKRHLSELEGKIVLTRDRQQILELLLSTISVMIHCHAMGIFLVSEEREPSLYIVSSQPLSIKATNDFKDKLLSAAEALTEADKAAKAPTITTIVNDANLRELDDNFDSFISVPLIHQGQVIGILNIANVAADAFTTDDVMLLFTIGSKSTEALNLISR